MINSSFYPITVKSNKNINNNIDSINKFIGKHTSIMLK